MRRLLLVAALAAGGVAWSAGDAAAQQYHRPKTSSVTWPSASPPGWYTSTYKHAWYYPWYAYYDFSYGPYANWAAGGGYATYADHGPAGYYYYPLAGGVAPSGASSTGNAEGTKRSDSGKAEAPAGAEVSVTLPADAKLLFNGTVAPGGGAVRTFRTPALQPGTTYRYELTAEVIRDGRAERVTEAVAVRAGEAVKVTLAPTGIATVGAK